MVVVDNCCQVRSQLTKAMPDIRVVLDVHHFLMRWAASNQPGSFDSPRHYRYLFVILDGTKNPHRSAVAKDITNAILKTRATGSAGATYWSQEEQESRLTAAYDYWLKNGGVWSAAASEVRSLPSCCTQSSPHRFIYKQTHLNQLRHVRKGCLARLRQDIRSDGSRIEGSHKGWNSLQRSFASGIELITALSHDFVLRRNCRTAAMSKHPSAFTISSCGTHHVRLVNHIARLWNALLAQEKLKGTGKDKLEPLPGLQDVQSGEQFGLIASNYTSSFKGLLEIKEECKEDEFDLGSFDHSGATDLAQTLNIDPQLLKLPSKNHGTTAISPNPPLSQDVTMLHDTAESAGVNATSVSTKRKSIQSDGFCQSNDRPDTVKRPRLHDGFQEVIVWQKNIVEKKLINLFWRSVCSLGYWYCRIKLGSNQRPSGLFQRENQHCPPANSFDIHQHFQPACGPQIWKAYQITAAVLPRHANGCSITQHLQWCGVLLVHGDVCWAAVGIILDDTTKMGHGDERVQFAIAETTGQLDSQEPACADG